MLRNFPAANRFNFPARRRSLSLVTESEDGDGTASQRDGTASQRDGTASQGTAPTGTESGIFGSTVEEFFSFNAGEAAAANRHRDRREKGLAGSAPGAARLRTLRRGSSRSSVDSDSEGDSRNHSFRGSVRASNVRSVRGSDVRSVRGSDARSVRGSDVRSQRSSAAFEITAEAFAAERLRARREMRRGAIR